MGSDSERRRKKRFGVKDSTVNYKSGGALSFLGGASPQYLILNLSETGLHFISRDELVDGSALSLSLNAPKLESPLKAKGKVVWIRKSDEHDAYRVGVEFTSISRKAKSKLKNLIDNAILDNVEISTRIYLKEIERL